MLPAPFKPYAGDRLIHDAGPHLMALEDCLDPDFDRRRQVAYHEWPACRHTVGDGRWAAGARRRRDGEERFRRVLSRSKPRP